MKAFSLILLISSFFFQCEKDQKSSSIKGYIVESTLPVFDTLNNEWYVKEYDPQYTRLYYYKDKIMVQRSALSTDIVAVDNIVIRQTAKRMIYDSFIFSKSIGMGMLCDSNNLQTARLVNRDSVLANVWVFKDDLKGVFETTNHRLISSKTDANGDLIENYFLVEKKDTAMKGACMLRLTKRDMGTIYYQLSPFIENERKMKLVEYTIVNNARSFGTGQMSMNSFELPAKLSELKIDNEVELIRMFDVAESKLR